MGYIQTERVNGGCPSDSECWRRNGAGMLVGVTNKAGLGGADSWKETWAGVGILGSGGDPAL